MQESIDKTEQELKILIDKALDLRKAWEQRRLEAENQIKSLDAKITAYQTALKDYWENIDFADRLKK
jgi:chromosome segregation ATPase